jgi:hypothetical protein
MIVVLTLDRTFLQSPIIPDARQISRQLRVLSFDLRPQTLRLSPEQRPFGRLLWYFASLQFIVGLCAFYLFLFSAQRWAHSQSRSPTASCNKGGRNNVADAGGEVTV